MFCVWRNPDFVRLFMSFVNLLAIVNFVDDFNWIILTKDLWTWVLFGFGQNSGKTLANVDEKRQNYDNLDQFQPIFDYKISRNMWFFRKIQQNIYKNWPFPTNFFILDLQKFRNCTTTLTNLAILTFPCISILKF